MRTVTFIPAPQYAREHNYDISSNTLKNPDPRFSGWLVVKGWNETIVNFWEIQDGKRVKKLKVTEKTVNTANRESSFNCYEDPYAEITGAMCVGEVCGDEPCNTENCDHWIIYVNIGTQLTCDYSEDPDDDPWGDCMLNGGTEDCVCQVLGLCDADDPCELYGIDCDGGENAPILQNNVTNPCIKNSVDNAISLDCRNKITNFINQVFVNSETYHLYFEDGVLTGSSVNDDAYTTTGPLSSFPNEIKTIIKFNTSQLSGSSKEYIAATILHEAVHAWVNYKFPVPIENAEQHNLMASTYRFNMMFDALKEMFPNLNDQDAIDLTWGGMFDTILFNSKSATEKGRIVERNKDFKLRRNNTGTSC